MLELSREVVALLQYLLPGFLAAWVFYCLTSHAKPSQFERIIQALILTFLVWAIVFGLRSALLWIGQSWSLGAWTKESDLVASAAVGILLGGFLAHAANRDSVHGWIRKQGFSTRTAHPSEWFGVLSESPRYVCLHLADERRLAGYPKVWPSDPDKGHFFLMQPSWLSGADEQILDDVEGMLVNVKDVRWVEVLRVEVP